MKLSLMTIIFFLFSASFAGASELNNNHRQPHDQKFTSFFHRRFDSWFSQSIYKFSGIQSSQEQKIWKLFLQSDHDLGIPVGKSYLPAFSYGVHIQGEAKSPKISYSLKLFNLEKNEELNAQIQTLISQKDFFRSLKLKEFKTLGLQWDSLDGSLSLLVFESDLKKLKTINGVAEKLGEQLIDGSGYLQIKRSDHGHLFVLTKLNGDQAQSCLGAVSTAKDSIVRSDKSTSVICHLQSLEGEALGPTTENLIRKIFKAWNLQPSQMSFSSNKDYELYWP